jgi:ATP:ADP antiporter, AAA family
MSLSLWRKLLNIHPGEGGLVLLTLLYAFAVAVAEALTTIAGYALFLTDFDAHLLPYTYLIVSLLASLASVGYLKASERFALSWVILGTLAILALLGLLYRVALGISDAGWLRFGLPIFSGVVSTISLMLFWNLLGRLFNLQEGKRLFGVIGAGKEVGAMLTGFCTPVLLLWLNTANLLWVATVAFVCALGLCFRIQQRYGKRFLANPDEFASVDALTKSSDQGGWRYDHYVHWIIAVYTLWAAAGYFIDTIFYTQLEHYLPGADQLAGFIGLFSGVAGVTSLLMQLFIAGRLLNRFRLTQLIAVTPSLLALCTLVFVLGGTVSALPAILVGGPVLANLLLYTFDNIDSPMLNLLYQPLPAQRRTQVQTLVDGIMNPLSMGLSGALLLLLTSVLQWTAVQLGAVLLIVLASWAIMAVRVGRAYPQKLQQAVANRTLDRVRLTQLDPATLAVLRENLTSPHAGVVLYALDLLAETTPASLPALLPGLLEHRARVVRLQALQWAERLQLSELAPAIRARLNTEGSLAVQGASLRTLAVLSDAHLLDDLIPYLEHPQRELRQGAMVGLLRSGELAGILAAGAKLNELVSSPSPAQRKFAAQALGDGGVAGFYRPLLTLLADPEPSVQRAALGAAGRLHHPKLWPAVVAALARPLVRSAAAEALVAGGPAVFPELRSALQRTLPVVAGREAQSETQALVIALVRLGGRLGQSAPDGTGKALAGTLLWTLLPFPNARVRGEVVAALNQCGYPAGAVDSVYGQIEAEVGYAAWVLAAYHDLGAAPGLERLQVALLHSLAQQRVRLFGWLSLLYDPALIRQVQDALQPERTEETKSYGLEILHLTLTPALKQLLLPLFEDEAPAAQWPRLQERFPQPRLTPQARLAALISDRDEWLTVWIKACALYAVGQVPDLLVGEAVQVAQQHADPLVREAANWTAARLKPNAQGNGDAHQAIAEEGRPTMLMLVEKVLYLKAVDFFADCPEELLAEVAALLEEQTLAAGQLLLAKGAADAALYLIVDGQVRLHDGERTVATLGVEDSFGELTLFNVVPQPWSVSAVTEVQLLRLPQEALRQVLAEHSDLSWQILGRLAQRLQRSQGPGRAEQAKADLLGGLREKLSRVGDR